MSNSGFWILTQLEETKEMARYQEKNLLSHSLIGECKTRLGFTISMIKHILEQQEAIRQVLIVDRTASYLLLTWPDFDGRQD